MAQRNKELGGYQLLNMDADESRPILAKDNAEENVETKKDDSAPRATEQGDASVMDTTFNLISYILGTGFLALPYAVLKGGVAVLVAIACAPLLLYYVSKLQIDCLYETDNNHRIRVRTTYREIGEASYPRFGGILVDIVVYFNLFTIPVSCFIVSATILNNSITFLALNQALWTCVIAVIILPTVFIERLCDIAWLSYGSAAALVAVFVAVLWSGITHNPHWNIAAVFFWDGEGFAVAMGIIFASYDISLPLIDMEESLCDKPKISHAIIYALLSTSVCKIAFALCAFLSFTSNTRDVIVDNLPQGWTRTLIGSLCVLNVILTFALPLHALVHSIERAAEKLVSKFPPRLWFVAFRIFLVSLCLLIAVLVANFASWLSLTGSIGCPIVAIIFPSLFHLRLKYEQLSIVEKICDVVLLVTGFILIVALAPFSFKALVIS